MNVEIRRELVAELSSVIGETTISSNNFFGTSPTHRLAPFEDRLRNNKVLWAKCEAYISDRPLQDFYFETISSTLRLREFRSGVADMPLTSIDEYQNSNSVAEQLVIEFEELPRKHKVFIEAPLWLTGQFEKFATDRTYRITKGFSLNTYPEGHKNDFPEISVPNTTFSFRLFAPAPPLEIKLEWKDWVTYFEFEVDGFIGPWEQTAPLHRVLVLYRAFCGLALSMGLIVRSFPSRGNENYLLAYRQAAGKWEPERAREIPIDIRRAMDGFHIAFFAPEGLFRLKDENHEWKSRLEFLSRIFGSPDGDAIIRASQWLFDSYVGEDDVAAFIKATVCLEILLGDKKSSDMVGLGELLSNRCAYLISSSRSERLQVIKNFREIYKTRSSIVHSGKNYLNNEERDNLRMLRKLCQRVILREAQLLDK